MRFGSLSLQSSVKSHALTALLIWKAVSVGFHALSSGVRLVMYHVSVSSVIVPSFFIRFFLLVHLYSSTFFLSISPFSAFRLHRANPLFISHSYILHFRLIVIYLLQSIIFLPALLAFLFLCCPYPFYRMLLLGSCGSWRFVIFRSSFYF